MRCSACLLFLQLGEHGLWDKQTEFELATRVPLLIKVPWATASVGRRFDDIVELVDMHATLADLAGLPRTVPTALPESVAVKQSQSFASLFLRPEAGASSWQKNASFSQWPVCTKTANKMCMACTGPQSSRAVLDSMGYSMRTSLWRLTIWLPFNNTDYVAEWGQPPIAVELYDHSGTASVVMDFDDDGEAVNVAQKHPDVVAQLMGQLRAMYSYDRAWLAQRMARMAAGYAKEDKRMGFEHAATPPDNPHAEL